jgi:hypothetical protein
MFAGNCLLLGGSGSQWTENLNSVSRGEKDGMSAR